MSSGHACRLCGASVTRSFVDSRHVPLVRELLSQRIARPPETFYPLHVLLCGACLLVQLPAYVPGRTSSPTTRTSRLTPTSWVAHARRYADEMTARLGLTSDSLVTEVASNDGYLLQHFRAAGIPVLGIEPPGNVARAAAEKGIRTVVRFLGADSGGEIAGEYGQR